MLALALIIGATAGAATAAVAWRFVRIAVPAYGYFQEHGHCKTEDMVLVQKNYPNGVEFVCRHIDTL